MTIEIDTENHVGKYKTRFDRVTISCRGVTKGTHLSGSRPETIAHMLLRALIDEHRRRPRR